MNERERGAGTILALALALVVVLSSAAGVLVVEGLVATTKAARAADLAALMAADVERGLRPGQACAAAETVARLNEAALVGCEIESPGERVRVSTRVPMSSGWGSAERRARAGRPP
ncbi:Rv3654c family TadE-like protein [Sinomonas gamaensis]|jgi:secretion/DNA translocation related TadE-like protein|uniref:Rv3654c family TadE-like protein n=1 Tax=Sinomonas gamaensis TaxID=2565624 RepID=UPI00110980DD|nr:Rv3654c family TadE-like protein [Sinomonas gamaensis]